VVFVLINLYFSVHWFIDHCLLFFFWTLYFLSFALRLLITPSNFSYTGESLLNIVLTYRCCYLIPEILLKVALRITTLTLPFLTSSGKLGMILPDIQCCKLAFYAVPTYLH